MIYRGPRGLPTNRYLETPRGYNPDSSPRAFLRLQGDRESAVLRAYRMRVRNSWLVRALSLDPLRPGAFNAVGGHCAPPCQDALTMWYMTTEPCHVSVLCVGVRDLGETEWSRRRCTGLPLGRSRFPRPHAGIWHWLWPPVVCHAVWGFWLFGPPMGL
jgi:hypothetical protein